MLKKQKEKIFNNKFQKDLLNDVVAILSYCFSSFYIVRYPKRPAVQSHDHIFK